MPHPSAAPKTLLPCARLLACSLAWPAAVGQGAAARRAAGADRGAAAGGGGEEGRNHRGAQRRAAGGVVVEGSNRGAAKWRHSWPAEGRRAGGEGPVAGSERSVVEGGPERGVGRRSRGARYACGWVGARRGGEGAQKLPHRGTLGRGIGHSGARVPRDSVRLGHRHDTQWHRFLPSNMGT